MAEFRVAAVFSNHMVLQRDKNINVFGQGQNGEKVTVKLGITLVTTIVREEKWLIVLPPMEAAKGYEMTVNCGAFEKKFINIAIGEVWLAGGQSNMELELQNSKDGPEILKSDKNPNVRFYYTQKNPIKDDSFYEAENNSSWSEFGEESAKCWSAVGYFFGKKLAAELNVTVGIIGCNWGGTSSSAWMSKEVLSKDEDLKTYLEEYDKAVEGIPIEQQIKEYDDYVIYQDVWAKKCDDLYKEEPDISWDEIQVRLGICKWPGPMNSKNPFRPAGLYECMLQRVMPYSLKGFIYYQGESDDHKPRIYYKLLTALISQWRNDWEDETLPFIMVQLPMHRYKQDEDFKNWPLIREAQMRTYQTIKNTGIAVILDKGEFNEIHPKDKEPVGERLCLQALYQVYHMIKEEKVFGPLYRDIRFFEHSLELLFDYAEGGFVINENKADSGIPLNQLGFEIAGADGRYVEAEAVINGSRIVISSKEIEQPKSARYLWTNHDEVRLFGTNGIPLAPFRTSRGEDLG